MARSFNQSSSEDRTKFAPLIWGSLLIIWFFVLCYVPDPRPLGAPEWAVDAMRSMIGLSEPAGRAVATIVLRALGVGLIGVLLSLTLSQIRLPIAAPAVLLGAALLAIVSLWINYGYFPIYLQIQVALVSVFMGSLLGLGGAETNRIVDEIKRRLAKCSLLE